MKTKTQLRLIATGLILFILIADISAQMTFNEPTNQPVLSYGNPGDWDDGTVWNPKVFKDGDMLHMWYTGMDTTVWAAFSSATGHAWSLDGINWIKDTINNPVITADYPWEYNSSNPGAIIKDNDTLKMWYTAGGQVGYATSINGITWNKQPDPVLTYGPEGEWDDWLVSAESVIKEGDEYKMWYSAWRPDFPQIEGLPQVGLATSSDGLNWTKYDDPATEDAPYAYSDPVMKVGEEDDWDAHRAFIPLVLKTGCGYEMWYTGLRGPINTSVKEHIGYAVSEDGIVWEKYSGNPVFTDPREWGTGIYGGAVLKYNESYHLWFSCFSSLTTLASPQIGYAVGLPDEITCLQNGISLNNQWQIDNFKAEHLYCTKISGDVEISGSDITNLDGLCNVKEIHGDLEIYGNTLLANLAGLHNLESINENLVISSNNSLEDLSGLENLKSINGELEIYNNSSLISLTGLDSIAPESITDLTIIVNSSLSYCAILNICEYLADPNGTVDIQANAPGCYSQEEVEEDCGIVAIDELSPTTRLFINPNPFSTSTTIECELAKPSTVQLTIYDYLGKQLEVIEKKQSQGKQQIVWNAEGLPAGIYFCVIKTNQGIHTTKLIKL